MRLAAVVKGTLSRMGDCLSSEKHAQVVMLGLDSAGKTTLLYQVKLQETVTSIPTIGFNVESVRPCRGVNFQIWDVSGEDKSREQWKYYYHNINGMVYVVDSTDKGRLEEAREELFGVLSSPEMAGVPLVVMANKQDMPGALKPRDLIKSLGLRKITDRKWQMHGTSATKGEGVYHALECLADMVKFTKKSKKS